MRTSEDRAWTKLLQTVAVLNGEVGSPADRAVKVKELEGLRTALAGIGIAGKATGNAVTTLGDVLTLLGTSVSTNTADISSIDGRVTTLETDLPALDTRVAALETDLPALDGRVTTLETNVAALDGRIDAIDATFAALTSAGALTSSDVSDVPTMAEHNALRADVVALRSAFNALVAALNP